jgi:hypothetical protein
MIIQSFHQQAYFCGKQVRLLHGMHAFLCFVFLSLALGCHPFLNECCGIVDGEGEECSPSSGIDVPL